MRYITERELRDQFASGVPEQYTVPAGCMLTPAARQYLLDLKLYRHPSPPKTVTSFPGALNLSVWVAGALSNGSSATQTK